jgi:hypothetical protein
MKSVSSEKSGEAEVMPIDLGLERLVGVNTGAALIDVDPKTIWRRLTQRKLRRYKCGSRTLVKVREVLALVKEA